jgi:hypothetical protein
MNRTSLILRVFLLLLAAACLRLLPALPARPVQTPFTKQPYLQAPGPDTITLMWESLTNLPGIIHYGLEGKLDQTRLSGMPRRLVGVSTFSRTNFLPRGRTSVTHTSYTNLLFVSQATLQSLEPGQTYTYSVEVNGVRTPPKRFKTFPRHPEKITFIAYGDSRTRPQVHTVLARQFKAFSPDFILHTGDLVDKGTNYATWSRDFFNPLAQVIDEVPLFPAIGNHEEDAANYLAFFHLPGQERYYSFDLGPVHLLVLDYHFAKATSEQFQFAREDLLAARAPWKIVMTHEPVFNIGGHASTWGQETYLPLFHEAKVDLVLAGHSHLYERFRPLAPREGRQTWPILHVTTGGGGAPVAVSYSHPALAARSTNFHFLVFEATAEQLRARTFNGAGQTLDTFALQKTAGDYPSPYLAQVYPEERLRLATDISRSLTGKVARLPRINGPADVMFAVRPAVSTTKPVTMEISLVPDSQANYVLQGGPLQVTIPPAHETNLIVWAKVLASGAQRITQSSRELVPPLVFRAKIKADWGETIAYGQPCHLSPIAARAAP